MPTAAKAHDENKNTVIAPKSPPINTSGIVMSTTVNLLGDIKLTSSINAENNKKQAKLALPTLYPLKLINK